MQNLIKNIRDYMNMNQSEFSKRLDVSFATVNRWENGHATPGRQAQEKLYALCGEQKVPVDNMIFAKIRKMAEGLQIAPDRQILYHGSKSGISGHIAPKSRRQCDFGKGFYMGTDPAQALTLICDYEYAKFYIVSIDVKQLAFEHTCRFRMGYGCCIPSGKDGKD